MCIENMILKIMPAPKGSNNRFLILQYHVGITKGIFQDNS